MDTLGQKIKARRKSLGLTQGELSGTEVSAGMISLIERDLVSPTLKTIEYLAYKLGITVGELLGETSGRAGGNSIETKDELHRLIGVSDSLIDAKRYDEAYALLMSITVDDALKIYAGKLERNKGKICYLKKEYSNAVPHLKNAITYGAGLTTIELANVFELLSRCHIRLEQPYEAFESISFAYLLVQQWSNERDLIHRLDIMFVMGYCYTMLNVYPRALECVEEAMQLMNRFGITWKYANFQMLKGYAQLKIGNYTEAVHELIEAEDKETITVEERVGCHTNIGISYRRLHNYTQSVTWLQRAIERAEKEKLMKFYISACTELLETYVDMEDWNAFEQLYERIVLSRELSDKHRMKMLYLLSKVRFSSDLEAEGFMYLEQAEKLAATLDEPLMRMRCQRFKAKVFASQGYADRAIAELEKANDIAYTYVNRQRHLIMQ
ncbi:MAG: hypothetical protein ACRC5C_11610 [Bacilli bacterium]